MTYRLRNIGIAVALAIVAALLTTFYVTNYKRHVRQTESTVTIYVAKRDIPSGTPGSELIKSGWIKTQDAVQRSVVPGAISSTDQIRTLITRQDIYAGEQVSLRRFAGNAEQGVRSQLHGGLRALSLPGTPDALLSGTLRDGDHVDMIANMKTGDCSTCVAARTVARDVLVLHAAGGTALPSGKATGSAGTSVMLAVHDSREAQKIWYAVANATSWSLALRSVTNATDSPDDVEGINSMLLDGASSTKTKNYVGGPK
jgi:Flp pilus assembly protein CpaB